MSQPAKASCCSSRRAHERCEAVCRPECALERNELLLMLEVSWSKVSTIWQLPGQPQHQQLHEAFQDLFAKSGCMLSACNMLSWVVPWGSLRFPFVPDHATMSHRVWHVGCRQEHVRGGAHQAPEVMLDHLKHCLTALQYRLFLLALVHCGGLP